MKIEADNVKGFQDFLPPESLKRADVKRIIEKNFRLYGFVPIETPVIEFDELMKGDEINEDEAISDRFRLKDRAGRNLGLRYEFTFQLGKIMKMNPNMKLPFRRYQIGEVFRDEPIGQGRFRQFTQCDIDIIGDSSINSDAEILSVVIEILKELKINAEVEVNNRKLLSSIIESVEIKDVKKTMRELDKIEKSGEDEVKANLKKYADANQVITLFKLLEKPLEFFIENAFDGADELKDLIDKCRILGVKTMFNPFMIRGLGYYTGNIFEVKMPENKNTIAGGGRYDKSVGKYLGREIPAVGISFGLERITSLANIKINPVPKAIVISLEQDNESARILKSLRNSGISSIMASGKAGKAMEYANSLGIPYAIFIGDKEVEEKKIKLKNMANGEEKMLTEKSAIRILSRKYSN